MKKLIIIALVLTFSFNPTISSADMSATVDYLKNQNQNNWTVQALVAANESNLDISFVGANTSDLMTASKNLLTLSAVNYQNQNDMVILADTIKSFYNDGQFGSADLLNDDFWGLMALASIGDNTYNNSVRDFILTNQNDDGGWSWSPDQVSDTNDTAAAIMALWETDINYQSIEISNALDYLKSAQNDDGGFAYEVEGESDGASTAWVIAALNKVGVDQASWQKNDNSPTDFLASLEQADGSYLWLPNDAQGSTMVTAYASVALNNKSYPVNHVTIQEEATLEGVDVRIEGPDSTICLATNLLTGNILEVLAEAADVCDINYEVTDTAYGPYVSSIGGVDSEGMNGWQYWVNWQAGMVSASEYSLIDGDKLLWGYGGFPMYASKLELDKNRVASSEEFVATVTYFDEDEWQVVSSQDVQVGEQVYQTDVNGRLRIAIAEEGVYPVFLKQASQYVRSNKAYITVGDGISETVDLTVNIDNQGGVGDDAIAFSVSQSSIDFGNLKPGQSAETSLSLSNMGNLDIYIEANILGSEIWQEYTTLNQSDWLDFGEEVLSSQVLPINLRLSLPQSISDKGQANGQLIFWAIAI